MKLFGQHGFGMLEATVALGMMGVGAFLFMKQSESTSQQQQKMAFNQAINSYANSLQTELAKKENCSATLNNLAIGANVTAVKEGMVDPLSPVGAIIPTGKILLKVRNPQDNGMFLNSLLYTTNAAGKDILRAKFVAGSINAAGEVKLKKVFGASELQRDFVINAIKNPTTGNVVNCYSDFSNLANTIEAKICEVDKRLVEAVGGSTTNCNPNISNEKLHLDVHTEKHCTNLGGSKVTAGGVKICRLNGASCPQGWSQYSNWSTTSPNTCGANLQRGGSVNDNAWSACSPNSALISKCGHGTSNTTASHGWSNAAVETKNYETVMRICYGGNCGDHQCYNNTVGNTFVDCGYGGGGSVSATCTATRTQIGCF
ncbi:MAG: hypothetical protein H0V66_05725 [Bdellovibrionales bacterium]|nr:hypothetical protein [Bdellovibrionales bacterium]